MYREKHRFEGLRTGDIAKLVITAMFVIGIASFPAPATAQQAGQKTFSSAVAASEALIAAVQSNDQPALLDILGPASKDILSSGDKTEDKNDRQDFVEKYQKMHRLVMERNGKTTLYIGAENWPTPIPLVHKGDIWFFDTPAGKQEILYRRVGRNELAVIQVCDQLVDAQKEYYSQPHDGEPGRQYAQKLSSDPEKQNGLYWQSASGAGESPIGPLIASASPEGTAKDTDQKPQPFQGYYFRVLTGQGANARGGARSYLVNGKMTGGFAFLAYPAEYRASGVKTFIVNQDGVVYEKDLGRRTSEIAKTITRYDPDTTWSKSD